MHREKDPFPPDDGPVKRAQGMLQMKRCRVPAQAFRASQVFEHRKANMCGLTHLP